MDIYLKHWSLGGVRLTTGAQMNKTGEKWHWSELGSLVIPSKDLTVVLIQIPVVTPKTVKENQSQTEVKVMKIAFFQ